jgi:thiamine-phosphate pyrophosphorylase
VAVSVAPALYLITDRKATNDRPLADVLEAALAGRAGHRLAVQLRENDLPTPALLALAAELRAITARAGAALYINDRVDVALAVGADGVHLSGRSLAPADVARVAPTLAVAVSTHARSDVERLVSATNVVFAVFGPVFDTPSKRAYGPPVGLNALAEAAGAIPLLALGGVTPERAGACIAAGASGVATIRAVMSAVDPKGAVAEFVSALSL